MGGACGARRDSKKCIILCGMSERRRFQWPRGLKRRSAAHRLPGLWVLSPSRPWMFVCCEYCALSDGGLCDELITRPEESYRLWCVFVCVPETSGMRLPWPALGSRTTVKKEYVKGRDLLRNGPFSPYRI